MKTSLKTTVEIFADYFQFYIKDGVANPFAPTDWNELDVLRKVKVAQNLIVICPVRNMTVSVEIEVQSLKPNIDINDFDHVVLCSLDLPSGVLVVDQCTGTEVLRWQISSGTYCVLAIFSNLDSLSENGLDGADHYRVVLWPDRSNELKVLKQYVGQ
jgi:hypothetical protein